MWHLTVIRVAHAGLRSQQTHNNERMCGCRKNKTGGGNFDTGDHLRKFADVQFPPVLVRLAHLNATCLVVVGHTGFSCQVNVAPVASVAPPAGL